MITKSSKQSRENGLGILRGHKGKKKSLRVYISVLNVIIQDLAPNWDNYTFSSKKTTKSPTRRLIK